MEDEEKRLRMAIISGAAKAVDYKEKNPRAQKEEVMQHIADNTKEILEKIDDPL
ncbi:MAG: hypothetical protein IIA87_04100 [Nanoarchaeota archaeon]|nr:hypothetical protein [Nanoarchaeota archaeon]